MLINKELYGKYNDKVYFYNRHVFVIFHSVIQKKRK